MILIVDDSALVRQTLRAIVEADPAFHVMVAGDPYEAVALMSKTAPAAIILDINMPRMDGLTFLRKLMRQHPLPVLLCTDHPELGLTGLEMGAIEVIPKPCWDDPSELEEWGARLRESLRQAIDLGTAARDEPPSAQPDAPERRRDFAPRALGGTGRASGTDHRHRREHGRRAGRIPSSG